MVSVQLSVSVLQQVLSGREAHRLLSPSTAPACPGLRRKGSLRSLVHCFGLRRGQRGKDWWESHSHSQHALARPSTVLRVTAAAVSIASWAVS